MEIPNSYINENECKIRGQLPNSLIKKNVPKYSADDFKYTKNEKVISIDKELECSYVVDGEKCTNPIYKDLFCNFHQPGEEKCNVFVVKKGTICGRSVISNGRCGLHKIKIQQLDEKQELEGCPCIIQRGENKGQKCNRPIKENGRCGRHINTCLNEGDIDISFEKEKKTTPTSQKIQKKTPKKSITGDESVLQEVSPEIKQPILKAPVSVIKKKPKERHGIEIVEIPDTPKIPTPVVEKQKKKTPEIIVRAPIVKKPPRKRQGIEIIDLTEPRVEPEIEEKVEVQIRSPGTREVAISERLDEEPVEEKESGEIVEEIEEEVPEEVWSVLEVNENEMYDILKKLQVKNIDIEQLDNINNAIKSCF